MTPVGGSAVACAEQASELNAALRHLQSGLAEALKECDARSKELESTKVHCC